MSTTNVTPAINPANTAANFLSSFSADLGSGSLSTLFENLLASTQNSSPPVVESAALTSSGSGNGTTPDILTQVTGDLGDLQNALHDFVAKWNSGQSNSGSDNNRQASDGATTQNASSGNSSGTGNAPTTTAASSGTTASSPTSSASPNTADSSGTASSSTSDSTSNAPPSLADLLTELQAILHVMQKEIQTAQTSGTTADASATGTAADSSTTTPQDLLAAGGALGDLLALAQMLEKKLGASTSGDAQTATANDPTATTNLAALDTQVRADLKVMMDALKTAVSTSTSGSNDSTAATADTTQITDAAALTTTTATTGAPSTASADLAAATPQDIIKSALATADDFLKQLNNFAATNAAPVVATGIAAAVTAAGGADGSSLDADQDTGGGTANASANAASGAAQDAGSLSGTGESQKSANPYSFASQLSATRAQNGGNVGLPNAVEQVLLQLNRGAKSGNDQMSLQLHPADLGTINIKLDFAGDGSVSGTVVASNADTLSLLQKDSRSLERALADAGLRADPGSLQFSLGGQSNNHSSGQSSGNASSGGASSGSGTLSNGLAAVATDATTASTDSWVLTPGRVNITV